MFTAATEVIGDSQLGIAFNRVAEIFRDFTSVFEKIAPRFYGIIRKRFRDEGPGFAPLSQKYAARKRELYGDKTILRATDRLYESFAAQAPGNINRITKDTAEFGSSVPYGIFHQTGTSRMPARPPIEITPQHELQFAHIAIKDLNEKIKAMGFGVSNVVESS